MNRLIERFMYYCGLLGGYLYVNNSNVNIDVMVDDMKHIQDLLDAEEQGLLLRSPCKVGMSIWVNGVLGCGEAEEYKVIKVDYYSTLVTGRNEFYIEALLVSNPEGGSIGFYDKEIGKTVFLTKEEAEQKLAEMGGE